MCGGFKETEEFCFFSVLFTKENTLQEKKISTREYYIFIFAIFVTFIRVISGFDVKEDFVFRIRPIKSNAAGKSLT